MLSMKPAPVVIEVTTPISLSPRYGEARPGTIVKVPAHRGELLMRSGCVRRLESVPAGREAVEMLDDTLFELPAPPPRPEPLDRPAVLKMLGFTDEQLDAARALGFPAPDHVVFLTKPGEASPRRVAQWFKESIETWRARVVALNLR